LRNLKCPFCRQHFPRREVTKSQWEVLDWEVSDVENDVERMRQKLKEFASRLDGANRASEMLEPYVPEERTIKRVHDDVDVVLVD
jgi:predicted  nucleic acid-binding Zn-ribbon protein